MSLCKTPVAVKTALARKYSGRARIEIESIRAINEYNGHTMPKPCEDAIHDSHARNNARREAVCADISALSDKFLSKDYSVMKDFVKLLRAMPSPMHTY